MRGHQTVWHGLLWYILTWHDKRWETGYQRTWYTGCPKKCPYLPLPAIWPQIFKICWWQIVAKRLKFLWQSSIFITSSKSELINPLSFRAKSAVSSSQCWQNAIRQDTQSFSALWLNNLHFLVSFYFPHKFSYQLDSQAFFDEDNQQNCTDFIVSCTELFVFCYGNLFMPANHPEEAESPASIIIWPETGNMTFRTPNKIIFEYFWSQYAWFSSVASHFQLWSL